MKTKKIATSIIFVIPLCFSSCADMTDSQLTKAQGTAAGAGAGALIGNLIGDDKKGTLIGAGLGAIAGNIYGSHVAGKKQSYASSEASYNQQISAMQANTSKAKALNSKYKSQISSANTSLRKLENKQKLNTLDQIKLKTQQASLARAIKENTRMIAIKESDMKQGYKVAKNKRSSSFNKAMASSRSTTSSLRIRNSELKKTMNRSKKLN